MLGLRMASPSWTVPGRPDSTANGDAARHSVLVMLDDDPTSRRAWPPVVRACAGILLLVTAVGTFLIVAAACSANGTDRSAVATYVVNADRVCDAGRARLRADPRERSSTVVLAAMRNKLRALGDPPARVAAIGPDVPEELALVTWASESFQTAGHYDIGRTRITVAELHSLGFHVCGTQ